MYKQLTKSLQRGISLLEIMLSLSIVAIILVMATRYFFVASTNQNMNKVRTQISAINSAVAQFRNNNSGSTAVTMKVLVDGGYYPNSSDFDGTDLKSSFGGDITLSGTAGDYKIVTTLPSAALCSRLTSNGKGSCADAVFTFDSNEATS